MISTLRNVWLLFTPAERRRALVILALIVLMALSESVGVLSVMPFLSVLGRPGVVDDNPFLGWAHEAMGSPDIRWFTIALGLGSATVIVLSSAFKTVALHLVNRFVHFQRHSLSSRLLTTYLREPYEFFLQRNPSELSKNVLSEVDQLIFDLLHPLSLLVSQGAVVVAMTTLVVLYDPLMALILIAAVACLYGVIYALVRNRLARIGRERQEANTGRYQACNEAFGGIKEVKVSGTEPVWISMFERHSREFSRHCATADTLSASPLYMVEAVGYTVMILIALLLLVRSDDMAHVLSTLGLYVFAAYRLLPSAQIMYRGFTRLRFSSAVLDHIHRDLELSRREELVLPSDEATFRPRECICIEGVRYAYPTAPGRYVLNGIGLEIPANTSLGIEGRSGSGKSTLVDILLGLLDPGDGRLTVDGEPITAGNVKGWQRSIGYVPQHIYLADATVAANIAFGIPPREIDMAAVERAARLAQIHDFIVRELRQGYQTQVGDRGIRLSGGQRQRLGIARALYRDPPVLILDEATSALDPETERAVVSAIHSLADRKTVIFVSHRESSLAACDTVVTLNPSAPPMVRRRG